MAKGGKWKSSIFIIKEKYANYFKGSLLVPSFGNCLSVFFLSCFSLSFFVLFAYCCSFWWNRNTALFLKCLPFLLSENRRDMVAIKTNSATLDYLNLNWEPGCGESGVMVCLLLWEGGHDLERLYFQNWAIISNRAIETELSVWTLRLPPKRTVFLMSILHGVMSLESALNWGTLTGRQVPNRPHLLARAWYTVLRGICKSEDCAVSNSQPLWTGRWKTRSSQELCRIILRAEV